MAGVALTSIVKSTFTADDIRTFVGRFTKEAEAGLTRGSAKTGKAKVT